MEQQTSESRSMQFVYSSGLTRTRLGFLAGDLQNRATVDGVPVVTGYLHCGGGSNVGASSGANRATKHLGYLTYHWNRGGGNE